MIERTGQRELFDTENHRARVFAAIAGYQERRKCPKLRKDPAQCISRPSSLKGRRVSIAGERSGEDKRQNGGGMVKTLEGQPPIRFGLTQVFGRRRLV
jgi:hypothetical protein